MFPVLFFVFVELPSMAVMLIHKIIMVVTGRGSTGRPLPIFLYRIIGVAGLGAVVVLGITASAIGSGMGLGNGAPVGSSGSPTAAVEQYVQVALVQRDAAGARALACRAPKVESIDGMRDDIVHREQQFGVRITVTISSMAVNRQDDAGTAVQADLNVQAGSTSALSIAIQFTVVQESGWRVCSAARLG